MVFFYDPDVDTDFEIEIINCSIKEKNCILILDVINFFGINFVPKEILHKLLKSKIIIKKLKDLYEITNSVFYKFIIDFLNDEISEPLNQSAENGFLDLLIYFHQFYDFDDKTCYLAAQNGHLNCIKYLHENGCYWDSTVSYIASRNGNLTILKATCVTGK